MWLIYLRYLVKSDLPQVGAGTRARKKEIRLALSAFSFSNCSIRFRRFWAHQGLLRAVALVLKILIRIFIIWFYSWHQKLSSKFAYPYTSYTLIPMQREKTRMCIFKSVLMMMNMFHKSRVYMKVVMDTKLSKLKTAFWHIWLGGGLLIWLMVD